MTRSGPPPAPPPRDPKFGDWFTRELERRGWSRYHFAQTAGVHPSMVYRWTEGQRPQAEQCAKIAEALNVDLDLVLAAAGHRPRNELAPGVVRAEAAALLNQIDEILLIVLVPMLRALSDERVANETIAKIIDRLPGVMRE
jgi:transcriptional regulator with XRE-family HTH domain